MIELSFKEFYDQNYEDEDYSLYVMKNELGDVLYIGISTADVWLRWFGGAGHIPWSGTMLYYTVRDVEARMIKKLSPVLNRHLNLNPGKDTTPKSEKELKWERHVAAAYDDIFNKKTKP